MWSGDATTTPDELIAALPQSGVDVLCITDHNSIDGALRFAASGELGVAVIVGEEVKTSDGELIGLFLTERMPFGLKPAEAVAAIRGQGGVVYVPHPFDEMRHCMKPDTFCGLARDGGLDVIETLNAKTSLGVIERPSRRVRRRVRAWPRPVGPTRTCPTRSARRGPTSTTTPTCRRPRATSTP